MPHSRAVRAKACTTRFALKPRLDRGERLGLEVVEHRAGLVGSESGRGGGTVDDLVGHPHQRVDVAHVRTRSRAEQPAGEVERGRIARDHGGGGILSRAVVERESGRLGRRASRASAWSRDAALDGVGELAAAATPARAGRLASREAVRTSSSSLVDDRAQPRAGAALLERELRVAHRDRSGVRDREGVDRPAATRRTGGRARRAACAWTPGGRRRTRGPPARTSRTRR